MKRLALLMALMTLCTACVFGQNQNFPGGVGGTFGPNYSVGGGTAQAQTVAPTGAVTNVTLVNGYQVCWLPIAANTGAAPTLAGGGTSTFTAKSITKIGAGGLTALIANDIVTTAIACAIYDGTEFQLQNPQAGIAVSGSLSTGSGASAAGATATGGFAAVEAASTGWTPTAGQDYCRADSTIHNFVCAPNGVAELPMMLGTFGSCSTANALALYTASTTLGCGLADFTYASHTLTGGAAGILDLHSASALSIPNGGCSQISNQTTLQGHQAGSGEMCFNSGQTANSYYVAVAALNATSTTCTNQVVTKIDSINAPTCTTITSAYADSSLAKTAAYVTATNCASSASPAVCGSAAAGSVAVPTGVTPTLVVNTTAVTANSQILFTPDESLGTRLSVTCNSTIAQVAIEPIVTARTPATSFTIQYNTTITVNPICLSYFIVN